MGYTKKANGYLLDSNPDIKDITDSIVSLSEKQDNEIRAMRDASQRIWEEKFNATQNAKYFCRYIESLLYNSERIDRVVVVTNGYPYGGERSFIEDEIVQLCQHFNLTIIAIQECPMTSDCEAMRIETLERIKRLSEENCFEIEVIPVDLTWRLQKYCPYFLSYIFDKRIKKERGIIKECYRTSKTHLLFWESIKYYSKARYFISKTSKLLSRYEEKSIVFYTYWHLYTTLGFCLNRSHYPRCRVITREHGYDLYDERCERTNRQPFREVMEDYLDGIVFACDYGKKYYLNRNNISDSNKYRVGYLGTRKPLNKNESVEYKKNKLFRIVSCSNLISLKRVDYIIDSIKMVKKQRPDILIEWIHFGDGELRKDLELYSNRELGNFEEITYRIMGNVDNDFIHEYYSNNYVDCFITVSSTEGLPVSILEAMSYGIPIIATDVGGIREVFG